MNKDDVRELYGLTLRIQVFAVAVGSFLTAAPLGVYFLYNNDLASAEATGITGFAVVGLALCGKSIVPRRPKIMPIEKDNSFTIRISPD